MKTFTLTKYGETYAVRLRVQTYEDFRNLCVRREVMTDDYWELWDNATVNVTPRRGPFCTLIDVNNGGEECVRWLTENGFGSLTGHMERSGFCVYPEFQFSERKLREQDPKGVAQHLALWNEFYNRFSEKKKVSP